MIFESLHDFGDILYSIQDNKIVSWKIKKIIFCANSKYLYDENKTNIEYIVVRNSERYAECYVKEKDINTEFFWNKSDLIKSIDLT